MAQDGCVAFVRSTSPKEVGRVAEGGESLQNGISVALSKEVVKDGLVEEVVGLGNGIPNLLGHKGGMGKAIPVREAAADEGDEVVTLVGG